MAILGYKRVSTTDQNTDRQLLDIKLDKSFVDYASGSNTHRPQLEDLMLFAREGDLIMVHSMDRLARNLVDLRNLISHFTGKGAAVQFVQENLTFTGDDSPMSMLLMNVMGAVAEFERSIIKTRQAEGIARAKALKKYKGRKEALTPEDVIDIKKRIDAGESKTAIAAEYKVSRETLYRHLNK